MFVPFRLRVEASKPGFWKTLEPIRFISKQGYSFTVGAGFETDLASIPRIMRPVFQKAGKHRLAAVLHDYLYHCEGFVIPKYRAFTRKECDGLFYDAMRVCGVSRWKAYCFYGAVRAGGWLSWGDK